MTLASGSTCFAAPAAPMPAALPPITTMVFVIVSSPPARLARDPALTPHPYRIRYHRLLYAKQRRAAEQRDANAVGQRGPGGAAEPTQAAHRRADRGPVAVGEAEKQVVGRLDAAAPGGAGEEGARDLVRTGFVGAPPQRVRSRSRPAAGRARHQEHAGQYVVPGGGQSRSSAPHRRRERQ